MAIHLDQHGINWPILNLMETLKTFFFLLSFGKEYTLSNVYINKKNLKKILLLGKEPSEFVNAVVKKEVEKLEQERNK